MLHLKQVPDGTINVDFLSLSSLMNEPTPKALFAEIVTEETSIANLML